MDSDLRRELLDVADRAVSMETLGEVLGVDTEAAHSYADHVGASGTHLTFAQYCAAVWLSGLGEACRARAGLATTRVISDYLAALESDTCPSPPRVDQEASPVLVVGTIGTAVMTQSELSTYPDDDGGNGRGIGEIMCFGDLLPLLRTMSAELERREPPTGR